MASVQVASGFNQALLIEISVYFQKCNEVSYLEQYIYAAFGILSQNPVQMPFQHKDPARGVRPSAGFARNRYEAGFVKLRSERF